MNAKPPRPSEGSGAVWVAPSRKGFGDVTPEYFCEYVKNSAFWMEYKQFRPTCSNAVVIRDDTVSRCSSIRKLAVGVGRIHLWVAFIWIEFC